MTMNMKNVKKPLRLTVGIPTCYGGESLVATAKSIRASHGIGEFRFIVVADRTPLTPSVRQRLDELQVEVYWNEIEGSQHKKLAQMVAMLDTDIFIYTQDDITFQPDTIANIVRE